jgi:hypothetical protein
VTLGSQTSGYMTPLAATAWRSSLKGLVNLEFGISLQEQSGQCVAMAAIDITLQAASRHLIACYLVALGGRCS